LKWLQLPKKRSAFYQQRKNFKKCPAGRLALKLSV
jgi:hypothetical protein